MTRPGCPSLEAIEERYDAELPEAERRALDAHLDGCPVCARAARRVESLASLLRAWDAEAARVAPPDRLFARTAAEVAADGTLRRREASRSRVRSFAAAAAIAATLGAATAFAARPPAPPPAATEVAALGRPAERIAPSVPVTGPSVLHADAFPLDGSSAAANRVRHGAGAPDLSVLDEEAAREAMVDGERRRALVERLGDDPVWRPEGPVARFAIQAFDRWVERRRELEAQGALEAPPDAPEVPTVPATPEETMPLAIAFPSLAGGDASAATGPGLDGFDSVNEMLERLQRSLLGGTGGGLSLRALPDVPSASRVAAGPVPLDASEAFASGRLELSEDRSADVVLVRVASDVPILLPAGELLSGGTVDRVVAESVWLPASPGAYTERVACRPLSRETRRATQRPRPVGAVAGPALRALLARGATSEEVVAHAARMLSEAGLDPQEGGAGVLALFDPAGPSGREAAEAAARLLPDGAGGFVATDPDGRFQGIERTGLPGEPGRSLLRRLLVGYVVEARARPAATSRMGPRAEAALLSLAHRRPTLVARGPRRSGPSAVSADVALTGLVLQAVRSDPTSVVLASALLPAPD